MQYCLFEDTACTNFLPLTFFRPVFDLRCGVFTIREKYESLLSRIRLHLLYRSQLQPFVENTASLADGSDLAEEDTWFINGRLLPTNAIVAMLKSHPREDTAIGSGRDLGLVFVKGGRVRDAVKSLNGNGVDLKIQPFPGMTSFVQYPWDLVLGTAEEIPADFRLLKRMKHRGKKTSKSLVRGAHLINRGDIILGRGSVIRPGAVLDAEHGPIVIGADVTIMSNAFIEGPAFVGDNSIIKVGAKIYHGTSIGPRCKVGGEVEASVIQSYSNKQHEGYLGHSYVGSWVNLGADTNTSDLKNTYGTVRVMVNGKQVDSGRQFVGLIIGDHSKSGINVMFDTGSVVGVACNVYGAKIPPKYLPSFSWGSEGKFVEHQIEKCLETARRVMARRDVVMSAAYEKVFREVFAATLAERKAAGVA